MVQPFRVRDGDAPGDDKGGWDEGGNVDLPGVLTVDNVKGSGSSTAALTTITFQGKVVFQAEVTLPAAAALALASIALTGASGTAVVLSALASADTFDRFRMDASGALAWGPGNATRDTGMSRGAANRLDVTTASLRIASAGRGLQIAEGSNATMGTATLVAGTVTVNTTAATANGRIFLTCQTPGGTPGFLRVSARVAGTSFTILSSSGTDTSAVGWLIVEPA